MKNYTVKEISKLYGLTENYIREEIKARNLKALSFGRRAGYRITENDLKEWQDKKKGIAK